MSPPIVIIEGNIGCGKSNLLQYLKTDSRIQELMYKEPQLYSFDFQNLVMESMMTQRQRPESGKVVVFERSIFSARYVFAENLYHNKMLTNQEHEQLNQQFKENVLQHHPVNLIIYMRVDVETLQNRIARRGRKEEASVTKTYIEQLNHLYDNWLLRKHFPAPCPISTVDATMVSGNLYPYVKEKVLRAIL
ncbi:deoxynucleoside kinase-like isoform X2 [Paramacrobiotus metropolitanus]|uniref:deoxynucleoside kinase-like isoform X2 n=1 Tax=Paramacrobiotus metropolitanus TaxID=2943436 RepID=UPI00244570E2|nr:deoxynucleoside kinase-like isoform X2 [Paramacrobiotus metropolitanus]